MQWLERGSVNANIAIVQWLLSKCSENVPAMECILHVFAKMFFTSVEALGDASIAGIAMYWQA